jgi:FAD/FMN-containing dehydrogenase
VRASRRCSQPRAWDLARSASSPRLRCRIGLRTRLKRRDWVAKTEALLAEFDAHAGAHRHFEIFPLTHSDYSLALAIDETDELVDNPAQTPEESGAFDALMRSWLEVPPRDRQRLIDGVAAQVEPTEAVDASWKILANVRNYRFNEMEYSVPVAAGAECVREILATIREREVDVVFPLEYRYVAGDDTWLGMSSGSEPHCAISIHQAATHDYRPYFDLIEPIFRRHGGRPHWGKVHSLGKDELVRLYPRFREFLEVRATLDPAGRMLNDHLRRLFGLDAPSGTTP